MKARWFACAGLLWLCVAVVTVPAQQPYAWTLPSGFPPPMVPADNAMSREKVDLGRYLFYDVRLSANGSQSCGTCHIQSLAFTDGRARSVGSTGQLHPRGSMSLVNVAYAAALTWGDRTLTRLEEQALVPIYGEHPVELGLSRSDTWLEPLRRDARYQRMFAAAFADPTITRDKILSAIAAFQRSIVSARSPYDRYHYDRDDAAVSPAVRRGEMLFHSRPLSCFTCHGGHHFSNAMGSGPRTAPVEFHNTGLYNLAAALSYPAPNTGLHEVTHRSEDVGKFKVPTLRNIAVTAPYMHDGSAAALEDVIDHYAAGGRTISSGPYQGVGRDNPNKTASLRGFSLTLAQRADLIAFLKALTDEELLTDPRFANPWQAR